MNNLLWNWRSRNQLHTQNSRTSFFQTTGVDLTGKDTEQGKTCLSSVIYHRKDCYQISDEKKQKFQRNVHFLEYRLARGI